MTRHAFLVRSLGVALYGSVLGVSACAESGDTNPASCGSPQPAFRVLVESSTGAPLPDDLFMSIRFGGAREADFSRGRSSDREVLCCEELGEVGATLPVPDCTGTAGADAGRDAGQDSNRAVVCDLWTSGAAELRIEADAHLPFEISLEAEVDERCKTSVTVDERVLLQPPGDAGI